MNATISTPVQEFKIAVMVWMRTHHFYQEHDNWFSQEEWDARKEDWPAFLTLQIPQAFFSLLDFSWAEWSVDAKSEALYEEWREFLSEHGYGHNISLGCFVHFYRLP